MKSFLCSLSVPVTRPVTWPGLQTHPLISHLNKTSEHLSIHKVCIVFFFLTESSCASMGQHLTLLWNQTLFLHLALPAPSATSGPLFTFSFLHLQHPFKVLWMKNGSHVRSNFRLCFGEKPGSPSSSYSALSAQCSRSASTHAAHASSATSLEHQTHGDLFLWSRPPSKNGKKASSLALRAGTPD